jgi:hypothetical protein
MDKVGSLSQAQSLAQRSDTILQETRWLAIVVVPFLIVASAILYLWPNDTGRLFARPIKPPMTAMMLGAAYMGGIYFFSRVIAAREWSAIKAGFLPVTAFASLLGVATILHWDRFTHGHVSFWAWAGLYFTTPFLVVASWLINRQSDPRVREPGDPAIPLWLRAILGSVGVVNVAISLMLFVLPDAMLTMWPWTLSPLTARVMSAMFALPGLVALGLASDERWSAARIILEAQALSIALILIAALRAWSDFKPNGAATWLFIGGLSGLLIGIVAVYLGMEAKRRASNK